MAKLPGRSVPAARLSHVPYRGSTVPARQRGAILLEVVLALSLFFMTATFVLTGLNAAIRSVSQAKLEAQGADLAVTVLSQVQMGLYDLVDTGPEAFDQEDLEAWTWQIVVGDLQDRQDLPQLKQVEVIIIHETGYTRRLAYFLWDNPAEAEAAEALEGLEGADPSQQGLPGGGLP